MRIHLPVAALAASLLLLFGTKSARAFECDGVTLPSSLVICSDPELRTIADERQQVYSGLWARLNADQQKTLRTDQNQWVRSYATECGVPPNALPPLPPTPSIIECFKRAGLARIAFLQSYLTNLRNFSAAEQGYREVGAARRSPEGVTSGDQIPLTNINGTYKVSVLLNGVLVVPFTVDSGAADVSLPADVFLTLLRTGTIGEGDYIGSGKYRLADGSTVESDQFYIRELKVGTHTLKRVAASVSGASAMPLLGQSFLSKFRSWAIDNERHALTLATHSAVDELAVARQAARIFKDTYAQNGMAGVNIRVDDCYASAQPAKKSLWLNDASLLTLSLAS
jgi:predicted aspartyl protease